MLLIVKQACCQWYWTVTCAPKPDDLGSHLCDTSLGKYALENANETVLVTKKCMPSQGNKRIIPSKQKDEDVD